MNSIQSFTAHCQVRRLPFRGAARHLFDFALGRTASVFTGLQRILRLPLLARCPLALLALFLAQCACVCHECCLFLLRNVQSQLPASGCWLLAKTRSRLWPSCCCFFRPFQGLRHFLLAPGTCDPGAAFMHRYAARSQEPAARSCRPRLLPAAHTSPPASSNRSEGIVP